MTSPSPALVLDLIQGFRKSQTLFSAVSCGLFDAMLPFSSDRGGGTLKDIIASLTQHQLLPANNMSSRAPQHAFSSPEAIHRLLRACTSLGLVNHHKHTPPIDDAFSLTPTAQTYLTRQSTLSLTGYIRHSDVLLTPLWHHLEHSVKTGDTTWDLAFPLSEQELAEGRAGTFDRVYKTEDDKLRFMAAMHSFACLSSSNVVGALPDYSNVNTLVDLGGGTGALSLAFKQHAPHLSVTLVDLPHILTVAERDYLSPHKSTLPVQTFAADFFNPPKDKGLPKADIYVLSRILHDWDDRRAVEILGHVCSALNKGGRLVIAECLLDDDACGPVGVCMQDLNMLVQTGGKERTVKEYLQLARQAGFDVPIEKADYKGRVNVVRTGGYLDVLTVTD